LRRRRASAADYRRRPYRHERHNHSRPKRATLAGLMPGRPIGGKEAGRFPLFTPAARVDYCEMRERQQRQKKPAPLSSKQCGAGVCHVCLPESHHRPNRHGRFNQTKLAAVAVGKVRVSGRRFRLPHLPDDACRIGTGIEGDWIERDAPLGKAPLRKVE